MMFPTGAISTTTSIQGNTSYVLVATTSPTRILAVRMQQSGTASETVAECQILGQSTYTPFAYNYAKDYPLDLMNYPCTGNIQIRKTGNDTSFFSITYLPEKEFNQEILAEQNIINSAYTGANFQEWLFVSSVVIFFLSFFVWRYIFRPMRPIP